MNVILRWFCLCLHWRHSIFSQEDVDVELVSSDKDGNEVNLSRPSDLSKGFLLSCFRWALDIRGYSKALECLLLASSWDLCINWAPHHTALIAPSVEMPWKNFELPKRTTNDISVPSWYVVAESELWRYWHFWQKSDGNFVSSCFAAELSVTVSL